MNGLGFVVSAFSNASTGGVNSGFGGFVDAPPSRTPAVARARSDGDNTYRRGGIYTAAAGGRDGGAGRRHSSTHTEPRPMRSMAGGSIGFGIGYGGSGRDDEGEGYGDDKEALPE